MNIPDLMLGDYIQVEDEEGNLITDYICDIDYVPQWNELGVRTCKCGNEWLRESEIHPIPLTATILEKIATKIEGNYIMKESFVISEVSREDLEEIGFDTSEVSDETMEHLARKLGEDYCEQLFWTSLKITAEYLEIPKKDLDDRQL